MIQTLDKPSGLPMLLNGRQDRPRSFDLADFPSVTGREEEWRFTPVKRLADLLSEEPASASLTVDAQLPDGITRTTLTAEAARDLGILAPEDRPAALAAAGAPEIVHYAIADGAELDEPVIIRANGTGDGTVHAHTVLTVGAHARATVVIEHEGSARYSELLSVVVGDGAGLTLASLQMWEDGSVHLGQHDALVGRDATYRHIAVSLGGDIVRLNSNVRYTGPGGEAELLGLYFADAGQHLEHRTYIDHTTPKATSNVMYKGALQGTDARTVWVGDVLIRPDALGIDTYELNRNLILTEGARADSVPNLEIETGDIEGAGHASSTGRFDEEHLFYLMSRGIPEEEARRLVVRGFFQEVILKIGIPEIEEVLSQKIEDELSRTVQ